MSKARKHAIDLVDAAMLPAAAQVGALRSANMDALSPEVVHDIRIAIRRLRSLLRSLSPLLRDGFAEDLRQGLAALDAEVRPVRDADVHIERLTVVAARTAEAVDPEVLEAVHVQLSDAAELARHRLLTALQTGGHDALRQRLATLRAEDAVVAQPHPQALLERRLRRAHERLCEAVAALGSDPTDEQLHRVRVLLKRARYLAEAAAPLLGRRLDKQARRLARMQQVLGEHQDSVTLTAALLALPAPTSAHRRTIDALLAVETLERARLRRRWDRRWAKYERRAVD